MIVGVTNCPSTTMSIAKPAAGSSPWAKVGAVTTPTKTSTTKVAIGPTTGMKFSVAANAPKPIAFGVLVNEQMTPVIAPTNKLITVTVSKYLASPDSISLRIFKTVNRELRLANVMTSPRRRSGHFAMNKSSTTRKKRNPVIGGNRTPSVVGTQSSPGIGRETASLVGAIPAV